MTELVNEKAKEIFPPTSDGGKYLDSVQASVSRYLNTVHSIWRLFLMRYFHTMWFNLLCFRGATETDSCLKKSVIGKL